MSKVMIIGCGGVASVAIHKCCQNSEVFSEIMIASRTLSKCDALKEKLAPTTKTIITTAKVDADCTEELIALIKQYQPDAVLNLALPYQDLTIMDACLACKVPYIDTANYEAENTDDPAWRAIYEKRCEELGFSAYFDYSCSGPIWTVSRKPASPVFSEPALTLVSPAFLQPMHRNTISMKFTRLIFWTATAAIMDIRLQPTSIRKSTSARYPLPVLTGKTATGGNSANVDQTGI